MLEKTVEARLGRAVKSAGGLYYKFISPGCSGVPDRIVVLPRGRVVFVELKTDTGRLSPQQRVQIAKLESVGAEVCVVRGVAGVQEFVKEVLG